VTLLSLLCMIRRTSRKTASHPSGSSVRVVRMDVGTQWGCSTWPFARGTALTENADGQFVRLNDGNPHKADSFLRVLSATQDWRMETKFPSPTHSASSRWLSDPSLLDRPLTFYIAARTLPGTSFMLTVYWTFSFSTSSCRSLDLNFAF